jgi:putative transposase
MVKILREADNVPVAEVAKKREVSDVTIYAWRKRFGKLEAVDLNGCSSWSSRTDGSRSW